MREKNHVILGLISIIVITVISPLLIAEGAIFMDKVPKSISGADFPKVVSYFDNRGVLWVFWMEDSSIYYSNLTDMSRWDITTSYKDYMRGSDFTVWNTGANPTYFSSVVLIFIALTVSSFALRLRKLQILNSKQ